jgi:hypothetical protein
MRLRLVTADAREINADVQFVKHFDGLIGGAEKALDDALSGALREILIVFDSNKFDSSRVVRVPDTGIVGSSNLLVLNLGELARFKLGDLAGAISHGIEQSLERGFEIVATPVIGISDHVGLPIERAYRTVLKAILTSISKYIQTKNTTPSIVEVIVFDHSRRKVSFFEELTPEILSELEVAHRRLSSSEYEIQPPYREAEHETVDISYRIPISRWRLNLEDAEGKMLEKPEIVKVLFLAANPRDTQPLRLDEEIREIDSAIRHAEYRNQFDIRQHWAVRVRDLQGYLLRHQPDIVHFSGHGESSSSIVLEDAMGESQPVHPRALSQLFSVLKDNIRCVVLNACYSHDQAQAIAKHIDCVVGMSSAVGDTAAISFAAAFYQAIAYGRDVKTAFELGCVQIDLDRLDQQDIPKLISTRCDPSSVAFVRTM